MSTLQDMIERNRGSVALAIQAAKEVPWRVRGDVAIALLDPSDNAARTWIQALDNVLGTNMITEENPVVVPIPSAFVAECQRTSLPTPPSGHFLVVALSRGEFSYGTLDVNAFDGAPRGEERREILRRLMVHWSSSGIGKIGRTPK